MKTLNLRSFAALAVCLSLFASCTKDIESSAISTSSTQSDYLSAATRKGPNFEDQTPVIEKGNKKIELSAIELTLSPQKVYINNQVIVTATIKSPEALEFGYIQLERAALLDGNTVVSYVSSAQADKNPDDEFEWTKFGTDVSTKQMVYVLDGANHVYTFSYPYLATEEGLFGWRLQFKSTNGEAEKATSEPVDLEVIDCVKSFTVKPDVTGEDLNNGTYKFTVTYTLTSPENLTNVKFQGGATSGGQFQHTMLTPSGFTSQKDLNQNTVLTYEGELKACTPVLLSFSYIRKFDCPTMAGAEVTGDWKATVNNVVVAEIAPLTFDCK